MGLEPRGRLIVVIGEKVWKVVYSRDRVGQTVRGEYRCVAVARNDSATAPAPAGWICRLVSPDTSIWVVLLFPAGLLFTTKA